MNGIYCWIIYEGEPDMEKKRVALTLIRLYQGGAEKVFVDLVNSFDKEKYDITIIPLIDGGVFKKFISKDIKFKPIFKFYFKGLATLISYMPDWFFKVLYKIYFKNRFDIEIVFAGEITLRLIGQYKVPNVKKIMWLHVDPVKANTNLRLTKYFNNANKVVCVSEEAANSFKKRFNHVNIESEVRYNPIISENILGFSQEELDIKTEKNVFKICSVGRLSHEKGHIRLVECAKRLIDDGQKIEVWILGEGNERKVIEEYITENNLEQSVKLLGFDSNPYKYIAKSDLFVCPSYTEALSTVCIEALILEIPVLTTDCAGMKEILGNSEYGYIVENNTDALFKGINRMINDRKLYKYYKEMTKFRSEYFDKEITMNKIYELLD